MDRPSATEGCSANERVVRCSHHLAEQHIGPILIEYAPKDYTNEKEIWVEEKLA